MQAADGAARVRNWFTGQDRVEERPRGGYGWPSVRSDYDTSHEYKGASYKLIMRDQQQDPLLPVVRLPGRLDERAEAAGFRAGLSDVVDPSVLNPGLHGMPGVPEDEGYEPDLSGHPDVLGHWRR
jgi:hypothetical protein